MRTIIGLTVAALVLALTGCGGGADSKADAESQAGGESQAGARYCKELKKFNKKFRPDTYQGGSTAADKNRLRGVARGLHKISGLAPEQVAEDWETLDAAYAKTVRRLDGLKVVDVKNPPPGITKDDAVMHNLEQMMKVFGPLARGEKPMKRIAKHAKSECGLTLEVE